MASVSLSTWGERLLKARIFHFLDLFVFLLFILFFPKGKKSVSVTWTRFWRTWESSLRRKTVRTYWAVCRLTVRISGTTGSRGNLRASIRGLRKVNYFLISLKNLWNVSSIHKNREQYNKHLCILWLELTDVTVLPYLLCISSFLPTHVYLFFIYKIVSLMTQ